MSAPRVFLTALSMLILGLTGAAWLIQLAAS